MRRAALLLAACLGALVLAGPACTAIEGYQHATLDPCDNGQLDPGETDVDCGGMCRGCPPGERCASGSDCRSGACAPGVPSSTGSGAAGSAGAGGQGGASALVCQCLPAGATCGDPGACCSAACTNGACAPL